MLKPPKLLGKLFAGKTRMKLVQMIFYQYLQPQDASPFLEADMHESHSVKAAGR
jgi:hypothetical protein